MIQPFFAPRVIKPEEGKKLADSWGAAFMESSAKENEVMMNTPFSSLCSPHFWFHVLSVSLTSFFWCRLLWRFSSGSFWRLRRPMETRLRWTKSAPWCKSATRTSQILFCWRQEAQASACDLINTRDTAILLMRLTDWSILIIVTTTGRHYSAKWQKHHWIIFYTMKCNL